MLHGDFDPKQYPPGRILWWRAWCVVDGIRLGPSDPDIPRYQEWRMGRLLGWSESENSAGYRVHTAVIRDMDTGNEYSIPAVTWFLSFGLTPRR